jgi:hypothetical protein
MMSFFVGLALLFIACKWTGYIDYSWLWLAAIALGFPVMDLCKSFLEGMAGAALKKWGN